jgi:hypothetical protein
MRFTSYSYQAAIDGRQIRHSRETHIQRQFGTQQFNHTFDAGLAERRQPV